MASNKKVRVRSRRLAQLDETKMSLAIYLLARELADFDAEGDIAMPPLDDTDSDAFGGLGGEAE